MICRFYFKDGIMENRAVMPCRGEELPLFWTVKIAVEERKTLSLFAVDAPSVPNMREVTFRRRDYRYPPTFIGPHRNSDYHEE